MAEAAGSSPNGESLPARDGERRPPLGDDPFAVSSQTFEDQFGETIQQTLDIDQWRLGENVDQEYERIRREVTEAESTETAMDRKIRERLFPRLAAAENMPKNAGLHEAALDDIASVHRGLLFNGGVEACDGIIQIHETLPLTIYQMGISLVSYRGDQGTWGQRLFRRDLRQKAADVEEMVDFLERRAKRDSSARMPGQDSVGELVQKAILACAERTILLKRSEAAWRLGHGNPVTYELLTGGLNLDVMVEATRVLRELVDTHQKFVFVAGEPREALFRTIGQALRPMEYAIISTLDERLDFWFHQERFKVGVSRKLIWDDELITPAEWIPRVIKRVASKIVVGLFRPTLLGPAQTFYAHVDHSDVAAHIALADSMLKEQGTSMLIEMAHHVCASVFGDGLEALTEAAYVAADAHTRFLGGRFHRFG